MSEPFTKQELDRILSRRSEGRKPLRIVRRVKGVLVETPVTILTQEQEDEMLTKGLGPVPLRGADEPMTKLLNSIMERSAKRIRRVMAQEAKNVMKEFKRCGGVRAREFLAFEKAEDELFQSAYRTVRERYEGTNYDEEKFNKSLSEEFIRLCGKWREEYKVKGEKR